MDSTSLPIKSYYRVDEIADYFNVSIRTVYRWCDIGILESIKIEGCVRIKPEAIIKLESLQFSSMSS